MAREQSTLVMLNILGKATKSKPNISAQDKTDIDKLQPLLQMMPENDMENVLTNILGAGSEKKYSPMDDA